MEEKKKVPSSLKPRLVRCDLPATRTPAEGSRAVRNGLAEADPSLGAHVPPRRASAHGVLATSPRASSRVPASPRLGGGHLPGGHRHWKRLTLSTHCPLFTQGLLWHSSTSSSQCTPLKPAATDHTRLRAGHAPSGRARGAVKASTPSVGTDVSADGKADPATMGGSGCQARRGTLWDSRVTVEEGEATSEGRVGPGVPTKAAPVL